MKHPLVTLEKKTKHGLNVFIAVDFDGTCVMHEYPKIGAPVPLAVETLRDLNKAGYKLILYTMRSRKTLDDAVEWFRFHSIPLFGINNNPEQSSWSTSPKVYAHFYIDDAAVGCPLVSPDSGDRDYVNWYKIREFFGLRNGELD